jgi:murein DD-endopeptidase MepM/ murein hydrolase activator NlpD
MLALAGCRASEPLTTDGGEPDLVASESASDAAVEAGPVVERGDPFLGIEAMRPRPWGAWPLENVDIVGYAGWHVDAARGFVLERGLTFASDPGAFVLAIADAQVVDVRRGADDLLELRLDHGDGIETWYAPLSDVLVHAGLSIERGAAIGLVATPSMRLRVTVDGIDIDPLLALRQPLHRWPAMVQAP